VGQTARPFDYATISVFYFDHKTAHSPGGFAFSNRLTLNSSKGSFLTRRDERASVEPLDTHLQASLAVAALAMVLAAPRPAPGSLIHHSDRGVQYACSEYSALFSPTTSISVSVIRRPVRQ
jgi:hypothetical protein